MSDAGMSFKWRGGKGAAPYTTTWYKCGRIWTKSNDIFNWPCWAKCTVLCKVPDLGCIVNKIVEHKALIRSLIIKPDESEQDVDEDPDQPDESEQDPMKTLINLMKKNKMPMKTRCQ